MSDPTLHLIAGPNGAGKSTFYDHVVGPATGLPFVNADLIAAERWPGHEVEHAYEASDLAARTRDRLIEDRSSFIAETVFSHPSKVELVDRARAAGYRIVLHVVAIPADLAVARVAERVAVGGHNVPEGKIRERHERLWRHVAEAVQLADDTYVYDNTSDAEPYRIIATYVDGHVIGEPSWPDWAPEPLRSAG